MARGSTSSTIGDHAWHRAVVVDRHGDLIFAVEQIGELRVTRWLPDLSRMGWSRAKREASYRPEPAGWTQVACHHAGEPAVRLLVPRRYQWWLRLVMGVSPRTVIEVRVCPPQ